jgi:ABC-type Fe3+/spermidine/putrescine transport system ATPase subunit
MTSKTTAVLEVTALAQRFGASVVLDGVTFSLERGERLAVVGASGSGKTTLLRLLAGLEPPASGEVAIAGKLASRTGEVLVPPERRDTAFVFQGLALFPHLRALDQIAFGARGRGGIKRAQELLGQVGLGHRAAAKLDELSGGERQRIALARALAQEPNLLLMDEPFASLDEEKRGEMRDLLRSLLDGTETALVLVTHSRDDALDLASRVIVLERGKPVAHDLLETVLTRPRHAAAVRALGLGQVVEGEVTGPGEVTTPFGKVRTDPAAMGRVIVLVRPEQPRLVGNNDQGSAAEVVAIELRPPDARDVRRIAVIRASGATLRVRLRDQIVAIGEQVHVMIDGDAVFLETSRATAKAIVS